MGLGWSCISFIFVFIFVWLFYFAQCEIVYQEISNNFDKSLKTINLNKKSNSYHQVIKSFRPTINIKEFFSWTFFG